MGGPRTGKSHVTTAIGVLGIAHQGKRVRFYSAMDYSQASPTPHSTVTLFAKFLGLSTSVPRAHAV